MLIPFLPVLHGSGHIGILLLFSTADDAWLLAVDILGPLFPGDNWGLGIIAYPNLLTGSSVIQLHAYHIYLGIWEYVALYCILQGDGGGGEFSEDVLNQVLLGTGESC